MNKFDPTLKPMIDPRWEGIYISLKSIVSKNNFDTLNEICDKFDRRDLIFRISKENVIKLCDFFKIVVDIHKNFQYKSKARMHQVIPYTHYILFTLSKCKNNEYTVIKKLKC